MVSAVRASGTGDGRWRTDGKFFRSGERRVRMTAVTYGPLPGGTPADPDPELRRIAAAGFNALRLYDLPETGFLDAARRHGLKVCAGLKWSQNADFIEKPELLRAARETLARDLPEIARHPALAAVFVGNEVPSDLVRRMGPLRVRREIEGLISLGRRIAPQVMFAYANYPSTEYLEPENADFTAFNVFLEDEADFRSYLRRLHNIAGDRPLVLSEFGLDSRRNGLEAQAGALCWALRAAAGEECAGATLYAWSDRWWNAGMEVADWDFGLTDRAGEEKPALAAVRETLAGLAEENGPPDGMPRFSVIVCTRNGRGRIADCLNAVRRLRGGPYQCVVADDGSTDGTAELVAGRFPEVRLLRLPPGGLSAARNAAAQAADGEWLAYTDDDCEPDEEWLWRLAPHCRAGEFALLGGPNLPPPPRNLREAVICSAPGAPSHVLLDDREAEHLPGCNLVVKKEALDSIGGFDRLFETAGDDVDFCWRLRDGGHRLGFVPGAFVWHKRRTTVWRFLRQQMGYGRAEKLLLRKHPERFSASGGARWLGFVYGGGPVRVGDGTVIYHGPMSSAGYQGLVDRMLPLRGLADGFSCWRARLTLRLVGWLQPRLRSWARNGRFFLPGAERPAERRAAHSADLALAVSGGRGRAWALELLREAGWQPGGSFDDWDLEKDGTRVQLATEYGSGAHKTLRIRVWGDTGGLPDELQMKSP